MDGPVKVDVWPGSVGWGRSRVCEIDKWRIREMKSRTKQGSIRGKSGLKVVKNPL